MRNITLKILIIYFVPLFFFQSFYLLKKRKMYIFYMFTCPSKHIIFKHNIKYTESEAFIRTQVSAPYIFSKSFLVLLTLPL